MRHDLSALLQYGGSDMMLKTVAIATALAVGGVLLGMNYPIAEAQQGGPYALSAVGVGVGVGDDPTYAWRINTRTPPNSEEQEPS